MVANVQKAIKLIYLIQVVANVPATDVRTFYKNVRVVPSEAPIKLIYLGDTERLTTEMGERRGWENLTNQPTTEMKSRGGLCDVTDKIVLVHLVTVQMTLEQK